MRVLMGQKDNPIGFRLGVNKSWESGGFLKKIIQSFCKKILFLKILLKTLPLPGYQKF